MQPRCDALEAYFDESGTHYGSPHCIIAGYRGDTAQFRVLEERWNRALDQAHVPDFHAKTFFAWDDDGRRVSPYDRLKERDREWFIGMLLDAIGSSQIHPHASGVEVPAFEKFSEGERKYLTGGLFHGRKRAWVLSGKASEAFYLPFQRILIATLEESESKEPIHFTFDQNNVLGPFMGELYTAIKTRPIYSVDRSRLGDFTLAERIGNPGLQAADLLAHCWYVHGQDGDCGAEIHRCLGVLSRDKNKVAVFNANAMNHILEKLPRAVRDGTAIRKPNRQFRKAR